MKPVCESRVSASHDVTTLSCVCQSMKNNDVSFLLVHNFYFKWIYFYVLTISIKIALNMWKIYPKVHHVTYLRHRRKIMPAS